MSQTLPKSERLSGRLSVTALFEHGKGLSHGCLRCKYLPAGPDGSACPDGPACPACPDGPVSAPTSSDGPSPAASRIVVSVPKRLFKRAVRRNLLKRRIRESYRRQKGLLNAPFDLLFIYTSAQVLPFETIYADMGALLTALSAKREMQSAENEDVI